MESNLTGRRILLVDDASVSRKLGTLILRRAGAEVVTAENGQEAVEKAETETFDLILLDMQMPVMDGYTAASMLRRRGIVIPIIAMTGHTTPGSEAKCSSSGCTGYLPKPIDSQNLLQAVRESVTA